MAQQLMSTSIQEEGGEGDNLALFVDVLTGLKSLNLHDSYFKIFKENEVNDEALCCLQKDDVKELIPKIGDRARFMKWLSEYNLSTPQPPNEEAKETTSTVYAHLEDVELHHPKPLTVAMEHSQGTYRAHSQQQVVRFVHPGQTKRYHTRYYCECTGSNGIDWWKCHDCGQVDKNWNNGDGELYTGCKTMYTCCNIPVHMASAGCTDQSFYPCCNQVVSSTGCADLYACCRTTDSSGCNDVSYYACCNKKNGESGCVKRYKCCKGAYPDSKGCTVQKV
eukprot:66100_1